MIGLGNAFRLPGLQKYLQEKLSLEVRKFGKLARVEGEEVTSAPTFVENLPSFAVAYGLALQGMNQTRLTTNLLPFEIHMERLVRGKKPWAVATAACLLLAVAGLTFARAVENSAVTGPDIDQAIQGLPTVVKERESLKSGYQDAETALNKTKAEIRNLAAGVDERWNWQLLHQYINLALPQPDGSRLVEESIDKSYPRKEFYNDEAKKAFRQLEDSRFDAKKERDAKKDAEIKSNLVQVNIMSVTEMFVDELPGFYKKLDDWGDPYNSMDPDERQRLRDKPSSFPKEGWLVEIRGYTYHNKTIHFVKNTFVENLRSFKGKQNEKTKEWEDVLVENKAILDRPFQPGSPDSLRKVMTERIENRKHLLHVYKLQEFDNPTPGMFQLIGQSYLKDLASSGGGGAGKGAGAGKEAGGKEAGKEAGGKAAGTDRSKWSPIGTGAGGGGKEGGGKVGGGVGGVGGGVGGRGKEGQGGQALLNKSTLKRTEFVVIFVWEEPYLGAGEKQPAAGGTQGGTTTGGAQAAGGAQGAPGGTAMPMDIKK
jgi:hypothetical protein